MKFYCFKFIAEEKKMIRNKNMEKEIVLENSFKHQIHSYYNEPPNYI